MTVKEVQMWDRPKKRPTIADLQRDDALAASTRNTKFELAAALIAEQQQSWSQVYGAMLEIEFGIGQSISDAGLCSSEMREHFVWSAHYHAIVTVFRRRKLVIDVESPEPMHLEEAYAFITATLVQALSRTP